MAGRRITFLVMLLLTFIFAVAYQEWLAWFLLGALASLPVFSLAVSLPALVTARFRVEVPDAITLEQSLEGRIRCKCRFPLPLWRYRLFVEHPLSGQHWRFAHFYEIPTNHCGILRIHVKKFVIFDYCCFFKKFPRLQNREVSVTVRPVPVALPEEPSMDTCLYPAWKPKVGGGFAENHELRLYRPGDNIQQIHWKLSAKTGSLILRQPMEPIRGRVLVRLDLKGTPEVLDRKLGQLLWLGQRLLEKDIHFQIHCLTGQGTERLEVDGESALTAAVDTLLDRPPVQSGSLAERPEAAVWQHFIGGEHHEGV